MVGLFFSTVSVSESIKTNNKTLEFSKSYNLLNSWIIVDSKLENTGSWLLQVLYYNYDSDKTVSSKNISKVLELDEFFVIGGLNQLVESHLVESTNNGYRLSEKGYYATTQRATSYCPHL